MKYNYCNGIDRCGLDLLGSLFTRDAKIDYVGGSYRFVFNGLDNILAAMKQAFLPDFTSWHSVHMPFIDLTGERSSTGRCRLLDYAMNLREGNLVTVGASEYQDTYIKEDERNGVLKR